MPEMTALFLTLLTTGYFIVLLVIIGKRWSRYRHIRHTISELGDRSTRPTLRCLRGIPAGGGAWGLPDCAAAGRAAQQGIEADRLT
jgi:hypothetical protein